jgi:hypothetical protein
MRILLAAALTIISLANSIPVVRNFIRFAAVRATPRRPRTLVERSIKPLFFLSVLSLLHIVCEALWPEEFIS